jgi:L-cysteine/cystine lyase
MQPDPKVKLARDLIPVTGESTYLSTGSLGPISLTFAETLRNCLHEDLRWGRAVPLRYDRLQHARECVRGEIAQLVGACADEIVLTQNTSDALAAVIDGFPWQAGDEVICTQLEHEACSAPLAALAETGRIVLRVAQAPVGAPASLAWLTNLLTPRTRLIAFSGTDFTHGMRLPIEQIARTAAEHGVHTLLDGAQCVGAIPLNLGELGVDFCAMPMQKWLCGPEGLGALYMRRGLTSIPRVDRVTRGWGTFEATAVHLEWLRTSFGWEWILERTAMLADYARGAVSRIPDARLLTPETHAGLVTFALTSGDAARSADALRSRGYVFRHLEALRAFRVSTAFFNTEEEIDSFVTAIADSARS